jgi:uncharacterized lipoprotein YbaY/heat shock protein HslJ
MPDHGPQANLPGEELEEAPLKTSEAASPPSPVEAKPTPRWMSFALVGAVLVLLALVFFVITGAFENNGKPTPESPVELKAYITIKAPKPGATLDTTGPVVIKGEGGGIPEGTVIVQAWDANENILAQESTTVHVDDAAGEGDWKVELTIPSGGGTQGYIYAFFNSPADGKVIASENIEVVFGEEIVTFVRIGSPRRNEVLDTSEPVVVKGEGGGVFEGTVVIEAIDDVGNVLALVPVIIDSPEAGTGGSGPWTAEIVIDAPGGTHGRIYAYSTSPKDGSVVAEDTVRVIYGSEDAGESLPAIGLGDHLWSLAALDGRKLIDGTMITIAFDGQEVRGHGGCNDYFGDFTSDEPNLEFSDVGSTRAYCEIPAGVTDQENDYFAAMAAITSYRIEDGRLAMFDQHGDGLLVYRAAVTGTVSYRERIALPDDALVQVQLQDISHQDALLDLIAESLITNPGQVPIPFEVNYDPEVIDLRYDYAINVRIFDGQDNLLFISTSSYPVITRTNPSIVEVEVEKAD